MKNRLMYTFVCNSTVLILLSLQRVSAIGIKPNFNLTFDLAVETYQLLPEYGPLRAETCRSDTLLIIYECIGRFCVC